MSLAETAHAARPLAAAARPRAREADARPHGQAADRPHARPAGSAVSWRSSWRPSAVRARQPRPESSAASLCSLSCLPQNISSFFLPPSLWNLQGECASNVASARGGRAADAAGAVARTQAMQGRRAARAWLASRRAARARQGLARLEITPVYASALVHGRGIDADCTLSHCSRQALSGGAVHSPVSSSPLAPPMCK